MSSQAPAMVVLAALEAQAVLERQVSLAERGRWEATAVPEAPRT